LFVSMPWIRGELLGEGGHGRVYECLNEDGTMCAAKVMPQACLLQRSGTPVQFELKSCVAVGQ